MKPSMTVLARSFLALAAACLIGRAALAQSQSTTGDATRGKTLFTSAYKCYACHGFDAQTGQRRLRPMRFTEDAFVVFVQNSPLAQMPSFPDAPRAALADIYAYIQSIPIDAPPIEDIPLLRATLEDKLEALGN
jgi:mono/diheme cytochrome c family protein